MSVWFITFHGGGYPCKTPASPAQSYTGSINTLAGLILSGPLPQMQELRGSAIDASGNLYLANAYKNLSQILQFQPAGSGTYVSSTSNPWAGSGLEHPFDLAFDSGGNLYASNQDMASKATSLAVTWYDSKGNYKGVFVPNPQATPPGPGLLQLRGIAWDGNNTWYVADEEGDSNGQGAKGTGAVYMYQNNGNYIGAVAVTDPIHLLYYQGYLFIGSGSGNMIYCYNTSSGGAVTGLLQKISPGITINEVSGMAIPGDGYLYFGNRLNLQVLRFPLQMSSPPQATGGEVFFDQLPDFPEFIRLLDV